MRCKFCGCEFELPKKGRRKEYCNNTDCIKQARNETQRKWYFNKVKKELNGVKHKIIERKENPIVVYSSNERKGYQISLPDTGDIINIARELGTIRYKLIQMIQKETANLSQYDKADQDFLHKIENLEELTDQIIIELVIKEKKNREGRRNNKIRYYLIQGLLNGIMIKNPPSFVAQTIQKSKNFKYIPRIIEELKKDENLYIIKEGEN